MARGRDARKRRLNSARQCANRRANVLILKLVVAFGLMWLGVEALAHVFEPRRFATLPNVDPTREQT
jgi:hypothetical protein